MRDELVNWFKYSRDLRTGIVLYRKYGRNKSYARMLNSIISEKQKIEILVEEFRVLSCLSFVEQNALLSKPVIRLAKPKVTTEHKLEPQKDEAKKTPVKHVEIPKNKLRDDFPFLNDADCPNELKILVSDKITAYNSYVEKHPCLFTATSLEDQFSAVRDVVENYIDNRAYWEELNHYKEYRQILGKHQFFNKMKTIECLSGTSTEKLTVRKDNLIKYVSRHKKNYDKQGNESNRKKIADKIAYYEWELNIVTNLLSNRK